MRPGRHWAVFRVGLALLVAASSGGVIAAGPAGPAVPRLLVFGATGAPQPALRRLDGSLRDLARQAAQPGGADLVRLRRSNPALRLRVADPLAQPEILLDAVSGGDATLLARRLQDLGLRETSVFANSVGGWLPVSALPAAAALPELVLARASLPRTRATGPVAVQGDYVERSAAVRAADPTLTGAGITVGVLSDSFDCYSFYAAHGPAAQTANGLYGYATSGFTATYADDQASGALPAGIRVLQEASCAQYGPPQQKPFTDEGRAMMQVVHAVAPGAALVFRTAINSETDFANGILQLQQLGARVIVDDIGYPDEPFFQDGEIAQAVDQVAAAGAAFFSAAGNDGRNAWGSASAVFAPDPASGTTRLDFAGGGGVLALPVSLPAVPPGDYVTLVLQWDQPFVTGAPGSPGASSALDLCIDSVSAATPADQVSGNQNADGSVNTQLQAVGYPACTGANGLGADPLQILLVGNPADAAASTPPQTINLSVRLVSGAAPGRIKLLVSDNGLGAVIAAALATHSPTIQGHPMAAGAVAMAAAFYLQTPACGTGTTVLESFSSWGGDPILFDKSGNRLATPEYRAKPDLTGPDGVNTTHLGFVWSGAAQSAAIAACQSDPAYPNFFGTSAAAPHAAATAALLWQSRPTASAAQVIAALAAGALPVAGGQSAAGGAGFLQADAALASLPAAAGTPAASHHGGGGALDGWLLALLAGSLVLTSRPWRPGSAASRWRSAAAPRRRRPSRAP